MRLRSAFCATATLGLVLVASPAHASTYCNLVVDAVGDGQSGLVPVLKSDALDLVSGDVASGATTVVGVLRLVGTDTTNDPIAALGLQWALGFDVDGVRYAFRLRQAGGISTTQTADLVGPSGTSAVTFTVDATSITWTAPRTAFPELATPGASFSHLVGISSVFGGSADTMASTTAYPDQAASCVAAA